MSAMLLQNATSPRTEIIIGSSDGTDHEGNTIVAGIISADGWKLLIAPHIDPAFFQGPVFPNTSTTAQPHCELGAALWRWTLLSLSAARTATTLTTPFFPSIQQYSAVIRMALASKKGPGCLFNVLNDPCVPFFALPVACR